MIDRTAPSYIETDGQKAGRWLNEIRGRLLLLRDSPLIAEREDWALLVEAMFKAVRTIEGREEGT